MTKKLQGKREISLSTDKVEKPKERPHPIRKVPGTGRATWNSEMGRWVVYARG